MKAARADSVPHQTPRRPWVASATLREIVAEAGADPKLLELVDLAAEVELVDDLSCERGEPGR